MMLDSNIIIYAALPEHISLRDFIAEKSPVVSAVSVLEVLGYHNLSLQEKSFFEMFFEKAVVLPISEGVIQKAVKLKQLKKMSLGDSLVAGTAILYNKTIVTANTKDFDWIPNIKLLNPMA